MKRPLFPLAAQAADEAIGTSGAESNFVCHRARI